jgi:tRNA(His) 5'-end guanylyltransferase
MNAAFESKQFPVKAATFIESSNLVGNLFTTDYWGGYMIYRFHPKHKVFFDGRSDMYGKEFLKEYESLTNLEHSWKTVLDKHQVAWILLPVNFGLATALKERSDWEVIYDDQQAIIFRRRGTRLETKS